ncbi:hypothetical protein IGK73_002405 [Enterococcus sp. AZ102]
MKLKIYRSHTRSILCYENERTYEEISTDEANAIIRTFKNVIVADRRDLANTYRDLASFGYRRREKNENINIKSSY